MKTRIQTCLILATILSASSLIARAADWTNWNNGQTIGSFYAVAGTVKETVAVGIDGRIATRNNTTGIWTTQTFTNSPGFQSMVRAVRHGKNPLADRKSTRLNSSHLVISYAVFCLKKNSSASCAGPRTR